MGTSLHLLLFYFTSPLTSTTLFTRIPRHSCGSTCTLANSADPHRTFPPPAVGFPLDSILVCINPTSAFPTQGIWGSLNASHNIIHTASPQNPGGSHERLRLFAPCLSSVERHSPLHLFILCL